MYNRSRIIHPLCAPTATHPMLALIKVFADIALWRKGPQHLPASGLLLALTVALYLVWRLALGAAAELLVADVKDRPQYPLVANALLDAAITLAWAWVVLALFKRTQRYFQTASALVGTDIIISPVVIGTGVVMLRVGQTSPLALPVGLLFIAAFAWQVFVIAHILRNALEITLFPAIVLTVLYIAAAFLFAWRLLAVSA